MVNETELKSLIENILQDMVGKQEQQPEQVQEEVVAQATAEATTTASTTCTVASDACLPDITKVDVKTELLVDEPYDQEGYLQMKQKTPARIGVGRAGARFKTATSVRFRADHAAAQDAVFSYVDEDFVKKNGFTAVETMCANKDEYITRPDFGRQFSEEMKQEIKAACGTPQVQIVIGDGLSSAAVEANIEDILPAIKQGLQMHNINVDNVLFVKHCRVPAMDVIGEVTNSDVVCLLIGERPGLVTAESMSAYIAYKPTVDMPEARRTVISNIHSGGTTPVEAGAHIADLIKKMLDKKASGLDLK
ncbi:ethanolamine ammonia-lyase subunit EutC [Pontibacillus litoralis]|uniref:Ethanolamine ammonia-lyase small subunit n=1 Tax=Pontibacillus litoralis JSM 072002 TaxID=1385512 RepID=A0A0A5G0D1_9BACI|nr:ethanolamine ammonia-lyase subunit EutC [Pontibacillus litoralis]KGX84505.1 ethanolamine ammonia-lyase small subunit [Pontibacillus litoralis JSM 072002]